MEDKMQLFIEEVKDMKEWQEFLLDNKNISNNREIVEEVGTEANKEMRNLLQRLMRPLLMIDTIKNKLGYILYIKENWKVEN